MAEATAVPRIVADAADYVVVSKPAGLVVHPGAGKPDGTLVDWLAVHVLKTATLDRHGLIHRLDKDTSGLVVVGKTADAVRDLSRQFKARTVQKTYLALVRGVPKQAQAELDAPITRHHADRKRFAVRPDGREALTRYRVAETFPGYALLEVEPRTGRTHQIRVHLAALGHPIVGDGTYGTPEPELSRQFLHAARLQFTDPQTGKTVGVEDPMPTDLLRFLKKIRNAR